MPKLKPKLGKLSGSPPPSLWPYLLAKPTSWLNHKSLSYLEALDWPVRMGGVSVVGNWHVYA